MDTLSIQRAISTAMANPAMPIEEQNWEPGESRPDLSQIIGSPIIYDDGGTLRSEVMEDWADNARDLIRAKREGDIARIIERYRAEIGSNQMMIDHISREIEAGNKQDWKDPLKPYIDEINALKDAIFDMEIFGFPIDQRVEDVLSQIGLEDVYYEKQAHHEDYGYKVFFERDGEMHDFLLGFDPEAKGNIDDYIKHIDESCLTKGFNGSVSISDNDNFDYLAVNPETGQFFILKEEMKKVKPGFAADGIEKYVTVVYDSEGNSREGKYLFKKNKSAEITKREEAILKGIMDDWELNALGVTSPETYGTKGGRLAMENMKLPTLDDLMADASLSDEKKKEIIDRVSRATQIIERNTPKYLAGTEINVGEMERDKLTYEMWDHGYEADNLRSDIFRKKDELTQYEKAEMTAKIEMHERKANELKAEIDAMGDSMANLNDYFDKLVGRTPAAEIGNAHDDMVSHLESMGMFDTWISDSRFANWLYDEKTDTLYKIDENMVAKGSRYSCLAKFADFGHVLKPEEREKLLDEMKPESREDAYLSLYTTTLEAAFGLEKKMLDSDKVEPEAAVNLALRLRSAGDYLDRLAGISDKWEPLKQEFKERFSPYLWSLKNAYAWAA